MQAAQNTWSGTTTMTPYQWTAPAHPETDARRNAGRRLIAPERIDVSHLAHNSFDDLAVWGNLHAMNLNVPTLSCDPLPAMNQSLRHSLKALVLTALAAGAGSSSATGLPVHAQPVTAEQWDNPTFYLRSHPTMLSPQVLELRRALPHADVMAIRDLYDLSGKVFKDVTDLEREYSFHRDHDTGEPVLFLTLRTHGQLDVDQLLERESALFAEADAQPALKAVQAYHVVTAV